MTLKGNVENTLKANLNIQLEQEHAIDGDGCCVVSYKPIWNRVHKKYDQTINLIIYDEDDFYNSTPIYGLVGNSKVFEEEYVCKVSKKCHYFTKYSYDYRRHMKICQANTQKVAHSIKRHYGVKKQIIH